MNLGVIADDFTGASDVANTLRKGGLATALAFGGCPPALPDGFDACVVGLKTRSVPAAEAVERSLAVLGGLKALGACRYFFKYCSTFDSTAAGNIGPVTEALADRLGWGGAVILCPAYPDAGRTVFQGHLFVFDRLLNESGMERHPVNPMTDPDLRRWLAAQAVDAVGHLPLAVLREGSAAARARLNAEAAAGRRLVVADAVDNADLRLLGKAVARDALVTGGSGIAMGLATEVERSPGAAGDGFAPVDGPGLVLAGSCSAATLQQVARFRATHPSIGIPPDDLMANRISAGEIVTFLERNLPDVPMAFSSIGPAELGAAQMRYGAARLAERLEGLFAEVGATMVASGVRRLVVAGGETSGAVVGALPTRLFQVGPEIAVGVPALRAVDRPLALALKSGNFGGADFFDAALAALGRDA